ncbi:uncharacterized protein [Gossypium hirsutum]|uniref:Uncharacterized protein n=1 Tax=Gossypium hirsutum TaxID=3635 RepID=A0ABM2Z6V0_GOSHI|nr:uncharacterized protein LOC121210095 [Gossypium hirsutum]
MLVKERAEVHPCENPKQAWDKLKEELMGYVHEDTPQQERVCARRNRIVINKETRQDVFEGKFPTKAVKEEKTTFDEQLFGTKEWNCQVCKLDLVENEAKFLGMATVHSADSESIEPNGSVFAGDRVITSFPHHDVMKLDERMFLQWQQQSSDGTLSVNSSSSIFEQQDTLLTSWLLSTISSSFLSSFTDVCTACDVWIVATSLFATDTTSSSQISEAEQTAILLAGLSSEYDAVVLSRSPRSLFRFNVLLILSLSIQCQICSRFGHLAQRCYYCYSRDEQSPAEDSLAQQGVSTFGGSRFPTSNGQNWNGNDGNVQNWQANGTGQSWNGTGQNWQANFNGQNWNGNGQNWQANGPNWNGNGQNWGVFSPGYSRPNVGIPSVDPRGLRPVHDSFGPALFVPNGGRPPNNGFRAPIGPQSLGQQIGNIGGTSAKAYGPPDASQVFEPRGSVRPQLNDGPISSEPNVNCVNLDRPLQYHAPTVPWRTKPRACVFDVDSSSYDSSQFVGITQLPEFHASDFSEATAYDSNFSGNDSYVSLPVRSTSWWPNLGATHHVYQNVAGLDASVPYSGCPDTGGLDEGPSS